MHRSGRLVVICFFVGTSALLSCSGGSNVPNEYMQSSSSATVSSSVTSTIKSIQQKHFGEPISSTTLVERARLVFRPSKTQASTLAAHPLSASPAPTPTGYCSIDDGSGQPNPSGPYLDCTVYAGVPFTYQLESAVTDGLSGVGFTCGPITWNTPVTSGALTFSLSPANEGTDAPCGPNEQNVTAAMTFTTSTVSTYSIGEIYYTGTFCESSSCTPTSQTGWHAEVPNTSNSGYELTVNAIATPQPTPSPSPTPTPTPSSCPLVNRSASSFAGAKCATPTPTATPTPCATICYANPISKAASSKNLDPYALAAMAAQESGGGCADCGNASAPGGLFQITPGSGCKATLSATDQATCAASILADGLNRYGDYADAFHYYNRGFLKQAEDQQAWPCAPYNDTISYSQSVQRHENKLHSDGKVFTCK